MKKLMYILFTACVICFIAPAKSQVLENTLEKPNIIKLNLTGPIVGYYTLGYERVINPKQSTGITFSLAPNIGLPFKNTLLDLFGDDEEAVTAINSTVFNSFSVMPEYRFYTGIKGSPFGFYAATFLKYSHMTHEQVYQFTSDAGVVHTPLIETSFNGFGIGELLGVQYKLGNSFTLDWWIIGPFVGTIKGESHGLDDMSDMDAEDKSKLESDIETTPIPAWNIDATIGDGTIDISYKGLFYGTRIFGLNLGYRF